MIHRIRYKKYQDAGNILNYLYRKESPDKVEALKAFNAECWKPIDYGLNSMLVAVEAKQSGHVS